MLTQSISIDEQSFAPLQGRAALVTGGCSGIGLETVKLLLKQGVNVVMGDIQNWQDDEDGVMTKAEAEGKIAHLKTDVTKWDDLQSLFKLAKDLHGSINYVFANAGVIQHGKAFMEDIKNEQGELQEPDYSTISVNLIGVMNTVKLAIWYMKQNCDEGSIVITGSTASFGRFYPELYTATKHGLIGFVRALQLSLHGSSIRVNAVAPSWTATGLISRDVASAAGIETQTPSVVAKSVALLFADEERRGQVIYSNLGMYWELEDLFLKAATDILSNQPGRDYVEECKSYLQAFQRSSEAREEVKE